MITRHSSTVLRIGRALSVCLLICQLTIAVSSQTGPELSALKQKASDLISQAKYTEALPLLEKIVIAQPDDAQTHFYLGFALIAKAHVTENESEKRKLRIRARTAFVKAKQLGIDEPKIDALIEGIPTDGSSGSFSAASEADRLMKEAEASFSQGNLDDALQKYQKALGLDPNLYHAALFSGDVFVHKGDFVQAEIWYQRAIKINPNRETAYRYSATPFMKQGKYDQARDRYIEAYISEPYNRFAVGGMSQWAQATGTSLGHPNIPLPSEIKFDEKGNAQVELDASVLAGKDDGSQAWISYGLTRSLWYKEKFARTFPNDTTYRHSLAEETEALQSVIAAALADKNVKQLNPSLAKLKKLNDEGLLEAFILLARADGGLAHDHPAYLKANRAKLRRYVIEYVVTGGGN